ncbi:protein shisa-5-like [Haliotis rufescens]|uniref:protein shisa-5-like n=1 Tax=Haliotis rufescens TaxID=6454 RepID=UPI00201F358C|nr:protein shisa-5-like [Haliotis rufescens]
MVSLKTALILSLLTTVLYGYEECYKREKTTDVVPGRRDNYGSEKKLTCPDRCCGSPDSKHCCPTSSGLSTGAVAGIAVGAVAFISIIVGIALCCGCCGKSSRREPGQAGQEHQRHIKPAGTANRAFNPGYDLASQPHPRVPQPAGTAYPPPPYSPPTKVVSSSPTAPPYTPPSQMVSTSPTGPAYVPKSRRASPAHVDPQSVKETRHPASEYPASVSDSHVYETIP